MKRLILCMKWGNLYGPEYVNILYAMVARNLKNSFQMVCFTDDSNGVRNEVDCLPLPELGVEIPKTVPGKWPKQALWGYELFGLEGVALFIDLDSVVVADLEPYFSFGHEDDVITARNWVKPLSRSAQTSVFRFKIGKHGYMLENLRKDPQLMVKYQFEQNYVSSCINGGIKFWPPKWTKHFGVHCMGPWPMRYIRPPLLPAGSRIVTFPGSPKPPDAALGRWNKHCPPLGTNEHIKWVLTYPCNSFNKFKMIKRYLRPTEWVKRCWSES